MRARDAQTTDAELIDGFPRSSRYRVEATIASGGMATVYVATLHGAAGFERRVAIKRAHPHLLGEPTTRRMMVDEARLASRVMHPNVVGVRDVEELGGEILIVMDYVEGASLFRLFDDGPLPLRVAGRVILDAATGLAAIHALTTENGERMAIVHRDISPANILVGLDGTARLADFGIAKNALSQSSSQTSMGSRRGKPAYMAPEYLAYGVATPLIDVFALGIVAWEALTSRRLFRVDSDADTVERIRSMRIPLPSELVPELTPEIDAAVMGALARDPERRSSARSCAAALELGLRKAGLVGTRREVEEVVAYRCSEQLRMRRQLALAASRRFPRSLEPPPTPTPRTRATTGEEKTKTLVERATRLAKRAPRKKAQWAAAVLAAATLLAGAGAAVAMARPAHDGSRAPTVEPKERAYRTPPVLVATADVMAATPTVPPAVALSTVIAKARPGDEFNDVDSESVAERAAKLLAAQDYASAKTLYTRALATNPRFLPARIALADIAWDEGQTESARRAYRTLSDEYASSLLPSRVATRASESESDRR